VEERFDWLPAVPESQRMSGPGLESLRSRLADRRTAALLVIRNDRVVLEWYAPGRTPQQRHYSASLSKAIVSGLALSVAMSDGRIAPDDPAWKYVPAWKDHPQKSRITIRHLATHSSGIEDAELSREEQAQSFAAGQTRSQRHMTLPGWKGAFWRRDPNPFTIARDEAPVAFPPGTQFAYSNPGIGMLDYAIAASLRGGAHEDTLSLLRERIMRPIGVDDDDWEISYGTGYRTDGLTLYAGWGGGSHTARAIARVGRLMLRKGNWEGRQLLSAAVVEASTRDAGTPIPDRSCDPQPACGLSWWVNFDGAMRSLPRDAFAGAGAGNQMLVVVPSLDLIVVRQGQQDGGRFWAWAEENLFQPLMACFLPPVPYSEAVTSIQWAPAESIIREGFRKAPTGRPPRRDGSDNWPLTWADDDWLYTGFGDGWGFTPPAPGKLSMGLARVRGTPPAIEGENIGSDAECAEGHGAHGRKASGMLMVDGVLYMWVRNANLNGEHSHLAWSLDHARTWRWADWRFEEFGYCTFLNFGRNYAGARDDYVYVFSHDHPSAYVAADRMILMRARKDRLADRSAYEFFAGKSSGERPVWCTDVAQRAAVFTHPGRCLRSGVSYDAPLKRYLWWQQIPKRPAGDTRFDGGFGVYDAAEPWGPWTCVYYTECWDVGPGETGSFPAKWMSAEGKTVHLVFSGDDSFAVRRAELTTASQAAQPSPGGAQP